MAQNKTKIKNNKIALGVSFFEKINFENLWGIREFCQFSVGHEWIIYKKLFKMWK